MKCERCNDTGKTGKDMYCICVEGNMQKRLDRSKRAAERKKAEEQKAAEAAKKAKHEQLELLENAYNDDPKTKAPCKLFDWVEVIDGQHKGLVGVVIDLKARAQEARVEAVKRNGQKINGQAWFDWDDIKPLPKSYDQKDLRAMIDIALDQKDKDWFMRLTDQLKEVESVGKIG